MTWWAWLLVGVLIGVAAVPAVALLWELWACARDTSIPMDIVGQARDAWGTGAKKGGGDGDDQSATR